MLPPGTGCAGAAATCRGSGREAGSTRRPTVGRRGRSSLILPETTACRPTASAASDSPHLSIGNDGGAYVSQDGGKAWEHMAIPIGQFYTVIVDSSLTPYQVCGGLQDNGVWCGPSRTRDTLGITDGDWYPVNGGDGMWVQIPANDPYTVYSGWQYGHLSRLDLKTWQRDDITPLALHARLDPRYPANWA